MFRFKRKYVYAGIVSLLALGLGAVSHSSVIVEPPGNMSLYGERFQGDREFLRHLKSLPDRPKVEEHKMGPRLNGLIRNTISLENQSAGPLAAAEKVRIMLSISENNDHVALVLEERGAKVLYRRNGMTAVEMPIHAIEDMLNTLDEIQFARLPNQFRPMSVTSEGVGLTGAQKFQNIGYNGSGVKVAVIDVGFKGLTAAQTSGDIPNNIIVKDYTGRGLQTQYLHGTACAEIVHDMAPQALLYLLKIADEVDLYNALDYCVANNIDIISYSLGTFGSGPGNGTGLVDAAFDEVRAKGILVVAAAGNEADGSHWQGKFYDSDGDDIHEFIPGDPEIWYNFIVAIPYKDDDGNPETNDVTVIMRWDNWPAATIDYDMYLYDYDTVQLVGYSNAFQNGSQPPLEGIVINLPDSENYWHTYALIVTKKNGEPAGADIEISLGGTSEFYPIDNYPMIATASSSIAEPADAKSVLAVGAVNYSKWTTGPQEAFSSQGPTNGWAGISAYTKPDISGPDGTSGTTYGTSSFFGTSAATPHVAGAAALVLSMKPDLGPDALQAYLQNSAVDMGVPGKDNLYGWGRLFIVPENRGLPWLLPLLKKKE
ncbi:MAG: S8 family serine peptidase [Desulfobulbaceae bacterium]|nr:S8 family serine peptidase [Desulfobulbaceae bacterium]